MNIIITGAGRGIGKAIALKYAEGKNNLYLCGRDLPLLSSLADEIKLKYPGSTVHIKKSDLSVKSEVFEFADWCLQQAVPDIIVNNAGVFLPGNAMDEPDGQLEKLMAINLYSAYYLVRRLLPEMIKRKSGHIFNIASVASLHAYDNGGGYSISKYAMNGFSKNLRHELKEYGIKVTTVFPGAVLTDSWGGFDNSDNRIMEASDIAHMIEATGSLSPQAVVEDIIIRPQLGDL